MKKKSSNLHFKSNFFKEQDPFHLVLVFFIVFFGTAIFFSIPTFYDYKEYSQKIEETINKEYKIKLYNLQDISFKFIPSPHLLIQKAELKIRENETESISKLENIKVFISITELYKSNDFKIKKVFVNKANLYLNNLSLKNFIVNLKKNIVNNFVIKNSTLFYKDNNEEVTLISTIKNFDYKTDFINSKKILKMRGNIFDSDYSFNYFINYNQPNVQNFNLELKDPNMSIKNKLTEDIFSIKTKQKGNFEIKFFNTKNSLNYNIVEDRVEFKNINKNNSNFDLNGSISFQPFHFNLTTDFKKINLSQLEKILFSLYKNQNSKLENLSGKLKVNFNNINNKVINKGSFNLLFENSKINLNQQIFNIDDFATLEVSDYEYLDNIDQTLQMKVKLNIFDTEKFNRFLFSYKKNKILSKNLFFTLQYNSNTKTSLISKISNKNFGNSGEFYKFKNIQQLKNLLRDDEVFNLE
jgi:hypothetical protein|tara:strand:- start:374 stop:1777 length:1404 start_codon:yes stop_codon:yes gene_type:complete